jgi:hypothetical protein
VNVTWKEQTSLVGTTSDGAVYRIWLDESGPLKRYWAVRQFVDKKGRLFEHTVGRFGTFLRARRACEQDAKSE